jgi:uridine kinase
VGETRIIGIAGLSCSGKTTLANRLANRLNAPVISLDDYYLSLDEIPFEARTQLNFDAPEMFDSRLLLTHLAQLKQGREILHPTYDFVTFTRGIEEVRIEPSEYIVVEGQYALYWQEINALIDSKVFLDIDPLMCLDRRIARDVLQRGRSEEEVRWRFQRDVLPMYEAHMWPTSKEATICIRKIEEPHLLVESVLAAI